jgi:hypothetical protein
VCALGWLLPVQNEGCPGGGGSMFSAQLLLFESPLPMFFCLVSWSVLVSLSSAYAGGDVAYIPVNAAAIRTDAIAIVL